MTDKDKQLKTGVSAVLGALVASIDSEAREDGHFAAVCQQIAKSDGPESFYVLNIYPAEMVVETALKTVLATEDWLTLKIWREWNTFEGIVTGLCEKLYSRVCCADKGRSIVRAAIKWKESGELPQFDAKNYWHPKSGTPAEWMALVEAIGSMLYGRPEPFILAYAAIIKAHEDYTSKPAAG